MGLAAELVAASRPKLTNRRLLFPVVPSGSWRDQ
jgi:hypothetical protein